MVIRDLEKRDYQQLVAHAKNVIDYKKYFDKYNEDLHTKLCLCWLNDILLDVNYGKVVDYNGTIIGVLLAHVPNYQLNNIFDQLDINNINKFEKLDLETLVVDDYNQNEIRNLEIITKSFYKEMFETHKYLIKDNSEILLFSVLEKHKGRGLANILMNKFKYDITEYGVPLYCLFTTSLCDYQYYEHKKMLSVSEIMINFASMNEIQAKFLPSNVYAYIFYSDARYPDGYDPTIQDVDEENNKNTKK